MMMKKSTIERLLAATLCLMLMPVGLSARESNRQAMTKRVLLLVSSIGSGHESAARSIMEQVKAMDPSVEVDTLNIRKFEFKTPAADKRNARIYWFIVKKYPRLFTRLYKAKMNKGKKIPNLASMVGYDLDKLADTIKNGKYDVVVAAHYGSATALSVLREQEKLEGVRIGWLNTDYILEYFHRFNIDKFFLGHEALTRQYREAGVEDSRLETTGIPVSEKLAQAFDSDAFRESVGLKPGVKTVVMSAGAEGVADFPRMVRELSESGEPLQLVAITGKNAKALETLQSMRLPEHIKLVAEGFIPIEKVVGYVRTADLYVTKSGGLMPTEAFTAGVPTILLDVYGGHESVNAKLFQREGMAEVVDDSYTDFGKKATRLLTDEMARKKMLAAQRRFQKTQDFSKIARFILDPNDKYLALGELNGRRVPDPNGVQRKIDAEHADIELLLSYAKGVKTWSDANPFGHLALRVDDTVYTANGKAVWNVEKDMVLTSSLSDYLYGVTRTVENQEFTDSFGEAYGRTVLGLKIRGVPAEVKKAIVDEYNKMQVEWRQGKTKWHNMKNNCADIVLRALKAGGLEVKTRGVTLPLTVYERFLARVSKEYGGKIEVVRYERVPGSKNQYKFDTFPVNLKNPIKGLREKTQHRYEGLVSTVVRFDPGKQALQIEKTGRGLSTEPLEKVERKHKLLTEQAEGLSSQEEYAGQLKMKADRLRKRFDKAQALVERLGLTPEQMKQLNKGTVPHGVSKRAARLYKKARAATLQYGSAVRKYHRHYDEVSRAKNELVMEMSRNDLEGLLIVARSRPDISKRKIESLDKSYKELVSMQKEYYRIRHFEGVSQRDGRRVKLLCTYYQKSRKLAARFEDTLSPPSLPQKLRRVVKKLVSRVKATVRAGVALVRMSPAVGRVVTALLKPTAERDFGNSVKDLWGKLAEQSDMDVTVEHRGTPEKGRPVIYVINHRHFLADHMAAYPGMGEGKYTFVTQAEGYGEPGVLRRKTFADEGFAPVGHPKINPVERISETLFGGRTIIIFPEGSVATPLGETRQLRPNFSDRLLPRMIEKGKFQIIPVTIDDSAVHYGESFDPFSSDKKVHVVFHEPVKSEALARMYAMDPNTDLPAQLLRHTWHETLEKDSGTLPGEISMKEVLKRVRNPLAAKVVDPGRSPVRESRPYKEDFSKDVDPFEDLNAASGYEVLSGIDRDRVFSRVMDLYVEQKALGNDSQAQQLFDLAEEIKAKSRTGISRDRVEARLREMKWVEPDRIERVFEKGPARPNSHESMRRSMQRFMKMK